MRFSIFAALGVGAATVPGHGCTHRQAKSVTPRLSIYFDQYHITKLPNKTISSDFTHVITAFASSKLFATGGAYKPFMPLKNVRAMFSKDVKLCMSIGGWADTVGFGWGANAANVTMFAKNVADTVNQLGYDCVDIDWEYPGGNGADYRQIPNSDKVDEITEFPHFLEEIKNRIGDKELSIAVPGKEVDMIAYTPEMVGKMAKIVDHVHVMTYDLMNRRDHVTKHTTSVAASARTVDTYIARGFQPEKMSLGLAFYAKWFKTKSGYDCSKGIGCPTELLEFANGSDTGESGSVTFEAANLGPPPTHLTFSNTTCGANSATKCSDGLCCSQYGFCGADKVHCGNGCQSLFGAKCSGFSAISEFKGALAKGKLDAAAGGEWYWDQTNDVFWSWETPALIIRKYKDIVLNKGLAGTFAWSYGEDSYNYELIAAMREGYEKFQHGG